MAAANAAAICLRGSFLFFELLLDAGAGQLQMPAVDALGQLGVAPNDVGLTKEDIQEDFKNLGSLLASIGGNTIDSNLH